METWFKVLLPHDAYRVGDIFAVDIPENLVASYAARVRMGLLVQLEVPADSGVTSGKPRKTGQGKSKSVRNDTGNAVRGEGGKPDRIVVESDGAGPEAE